MTLALLAKVGELVVAFDARQIYQIHHVSDLPAKQRESNIYSLELEQQSIPGWDLGELFGYGPATNAWIVVEVKSGSASVARKFGLRVSACITVRELPPIKALPKKLYSTRPGAISGAFSTEGIAELPDTPSGVVIDLSHVLTPVELDAGMRIARDHRGAVE